MWGAFADDDIDDDDVSQGFGWMIFKAGTTKKMSFSTFRGGELAGLDQIWRTPHWDIKTRDPGVHLFGRARMLRVYFFIIQ